MTTGEDPSTQTAPAALALGARLRAGRERLGLTVAQVAEKLHCDQATVTALESEDFARLGAVVFVKGHLRRYGELLREPIGELCEAYDRHRDRAAALPDLTSIPQAERQADPNKLLRPVMVALAGLAAAFAVWWVLQRPRATPAPPPDTRAVTQDSAALDAKPAEGTDPTSSAATTVPPSTEAANTTTVGADTAAAASSANAIAPAATTAPVSAAAATRVSLSLSARADCWTEVYDARGKQLYFNVLRAGVRRDVEGEAPLRVVLGNANGVRLRANGQDVRLPREVQRVGTAFFRLRGDGTVETLR
jgi:cytoskeleton protein RodZ